MSKQIAATTEQKEILRKQLERAQHVLMLKQRQIDYKRELSTINFKLSSAVGSDDQLDEQTLWASRYNLEGLIADNDAELLVADLEEIKLVVANLEMVLKAAESNIMIPGVVPGKKLS